MKPAPVIAMLVLIGLSVWLVAQPALERGRYDMAVRIGGEEILVNVLSGSAGADPVRYEIIAPERLARTVGVVPAARFDRLVADEVAAWNSRPVLERKLLGFFNVTGWNTFGWVIVGLAGQALFFVRMLIQWVKSENARKSVVPELFWWASLLGGACLFTYFVWRRDIVGVLGQSTGVVIYARNLRLIYKQKRRDAQTAGVAALDSED